MKHIISIILSVILVATSSVFFFLDKIETGFRRMTAQFIEQRPKEFEAAIEALAEEIFAPPPLKRIDSDSAVNIPKSGIIASTNQERLSAGLRPLAEDPLLARAADQKLADMIKSNYFAHVSPQGAGPDVWVKKERYRYILVGENLAMGNFEDAEDLIRAWMESPGHRANIMNPKYREIGVAARKGTIDGETSLIAVQIFGMPVSACPEPNDSLRTSIETYDNTLKVLRMRLDESKSDADAAKEEENRERYNALVNDYNTLVAQYNAIATEAKKAVEEYNTGIRAFNTCAANDR